MRNHFDTDSFEHYVSEASHLLRWAGYFARRGHFLRAAKGGTAGSGERERAHVYQHKAGKAFNAARQFLPH